MIDELDKIATKIERMTMRTATGTFTVTITIALPEDLPCEDVRGELQKVFKVHDDPRIEAISVVLTHLSYGV